MAVPQVQPRPHLESRYARLCVKTSRSTSGGLTHIAPGDRCVAIGARQRTLEGTALPNLEQASRYEATWRLPTFEECLCDLVGRDQGDLQMPSASPVPCHGR